MKIKKWMIVPTMIIFVLSMAVLGTPQSSRQQQPPQRQSMGNQGMEEGHRPPHPPHPLMTVLDSNRDHTISASEIAGSIKALLTLDQDGDGMLSKEELRPKHTGQHPGSDSNDNKHVRSENRQQGQGRNYSQSQDRQGTQGRRQPPLLPAMKAMDTDGDNQLTAAEIARAPQALLTLDTNGDGQLSQEETRPAPPTRQDK